MKIALRRDNLRIDLLDSAKDYFRAFGGGGWGKPNVANFTVAGAAPGFKVRGQRVTGRTLSLPIAVFADDVLTLNSRLETMASLFDGELTIEATLEDGSIYTMPAVYESGFEGIWEWGKPLARFESIVFQCSDPFWTSDAISELPLVVGTQYDFLDTLTVSSSTISGSHQLVNPGSAPADPVWVFSGPFSDISVAIDGVGFEVIEPLLIGEVLRIQFDGWVWQPTIDNVLVDYSIFAPGAQFPKVQAGANTLAVVANGSSTDSVIRVQWPEKRQVLY